MIYDYELNDEQTVKQTIKEALHEGMHLVSCKSCGETLFVPGNLKDIMNNDFICVRCQIKKQREG